MAKMATAKPANKVVGGSVGAALTTIIFWFLAEQGMEIPVPVQGAIVVVLTFLFGYFVPPGKADTTVD